MDTWKTSSGPLFHIVASGSAAAGQFTLDVLQICFVLSPECEEGHTWDPCLAPFGEPQPQHTKTHILGPLASIGGIPVLRGSSPLGTAVFGSRVVYPPRFLRPRFHPRTFS